MLIHITDQSRMRMVRDAPDTLRAHDKRHRAPTLGLAGGIAGFFAPCGDVASNRTNFRSPVAYYAILTNDRITRMHGHIFAATNRPTNGACAPRTAKNAPHPEQTTHGKDVTTGTLGGSTRQSPALLISSGHGGNRVTGSLHTRAKSKLWNTAAAPPGGARTRRAGGGHLMTFLVSFRATACAPWSAWIGIDLGQSTVAHA